MDSGLNNEPEVTLSERSTREIKYGIPTPEQLARINRMTLVPMESDDLFVFRPLMIDDQETSRCSKVHPNLLQKFIKDSNKGIALLMSHDNDRLPVGRTFNTELVNEYDAEAGYCNSLYGEVYIDLGRNTEGGMNTTDIAKGIASGTIFDVSVGFSAKNYKCSICNNDIRNWMKCEHFPGRDYVVENGDGTQSIQKCLVIIGVDGIGELVEVSLVYAGACGRATIKNNFSRVAVTNNDNSSKLSLVEDIKKVPLDATIYQRYSRGRYEMYLTDLDTIELKRSEPNVEYLEIIKTTLGIELDSVEQLQSKLEEYKTSKDSEFEVLKVDLENAKTELANRDEVIEALKVDVASAETNLTEKTDLIDELTRKNAELSEKAGVAETYQQELIKSTIEAGVRVQGNAFQAEMFEKFLNTLSLEEVKTVKLGFEKEFEVKFSGAPRHTSVSEPLDRNATPTSREDFEDELAFRSFVAEKAMEYSVENKVSLKEATQKIINDFINKRSE